MNSKKARTVEDISKLVFQRKLSAAIIKLLDSESSTRLLNLTPCRSPRRAEGETPGSGRYHG